MFCLVGVGNALVDATVYALLVTLLGWTGTLEATAASVVGFLAGAAHSFFWNARVTFRGRRGTERTSTLAGRFFTVAVCGAAVAAVTSFAVLAWWPFALRLAAAKAFAIAAALAWNFSMSRAWVFRRPG